MLLFFLGSLRKYVYIFFPALILLAPGCKNQDDENLKLAQGYLDDFLVNIDQMQLTNDLTIIDDSLELWGLSGTILKEPYGVRYKIEKKGNGDKPELTNIIRFKYAGKLLATGNEFDSGEDISSYLYGLIAGFQTALPLIPEGSVITLYIPSGLGYGPNDINDQNGKLLIPKNSNLIFEVELLEVL